MNRHQPLGPSGLAMLATCIVVYPFLAAFALSLIFQQGRYETIFEFLMFSFGAFLTTATVTSLRHGRAESSL